MKFGNDEVSLSDTFKRIYENRDEINKKIEKMIKQWKKEDIERARQKL